MYKFRRAAAADIEALVRLLQELTQLEEDFDFDAVAHRKGLELLLKAETDRVCVLVAEAGGRIVGMCSGQVVLSTAMGGRSVWVEDVVVTAEQRGSGIGKRMLEELEIWARDGARASRMQLWADKDNLSAIEFYNRNGWNTANGIVLKKLL